MPALVVKPYTIQILCETFKEYSKAPSLRSVANKSHINYFDSYLSKVKAETLVVEPEYVDRDFLSDYAAYYVNCFHEYKRYCARIHFFSISFSQEKLEALLEGHSLKDLDYQKLKSSYIGFVVVKNLPGTFIGRTCLTTYSCEGRRYYTATRNYEVNLYGLKLEIKSLAFQEQDRVAAACATSALWTAFQGTGKLFQHEILSPVEITHLATKHLPIDSRALPSHGLSPQHMAEAIRQVNLEPLLVGLKDEFILQSTIYAYSRGNIPIPMICNLYNFSNPKKPEPLGKHAVVVTGYSLGRNQCVPAPIGDLLLRATKMDKLYAHDDQVGPFAKNEIDGLYNNLGIPTLSYSQGDQSAQGPIRMEPEALLLPLYHKIRIPFKLILDQITALDAMIEALRQSGALNLSHRIEWDIHLSSVNKIKSDIFKGRGNLTGSYRRRILEESLSRFLWRAKARINNRLKFELVFDSTGIEGGNIYLIKIIYSKAFYNALSKAISANKQTALQVPFLQAIEPLIEDLSNFN